MNIVFMSMDTLPSTLWARDLYRLRCVCVPAGAGTAKSAANAPQRTERNAAADSCYAGNAGRICLIKRFTVVNRNDWFR